MRIGIDIHHLRLDQRGIYYYLWNTLAAMEKTRAPHAVSLFLYGPPWMTRRNQLAELRAHLPSMPIRHVWDGPSPRLLGPRFGANGAPTPRWARAFDRKAALPLYRKVLAFEIKHPRKGRWLTQWWHNHPIGSSVDVFHHPAGLVFPVQPKANVMTIHDLIPLHFPDANEEAAAYFTESYHRAMAMDAIIAVSEYTKRDVIQRLGVADDRVHVIPEAAHPHYRPIADRDVIQSVLAKYEIGPSPYILCIGAMEKRKNVSRLVDAFARLKSAHPANDHQLVLAGGGDPKLCDGVKKLVADLGLNARTTFPGYVPFEDLPYLMCGADLFVFPSLFEGFGLPPLEAMACGTPVVASDATSIPEVVGDAGILVDASDVDALAQAMANVLNDRTLHGKLRERGLTRARQFSWEKTARATLRVYEEAWNRWRSEGKHRKPTLPPTAYQNRLHEWVIEQTREHMYDGSFAQWEPAWP